MVVTAFDKKTNRTFEKRFNSPFLAEKWIKKCKYSKTIRIIGVSSDSCVYERVV